MSKSEMLINYIPGEECRIAITTDGKLEEFYQERESAQSHVGNIYQGRVTNVEPSIQAAFIDFGLERNGFLHITDVHPMYFPGKDREEFERVGSKTPHHERPPIQKCFKRGQQVLVQVLKEGIGTKGPTLTSYLSIPGRFLVMMPHMQRLGVSRKVDDDDARREMRKILADLNPPEDFGFIIRTAGIGQTKTELKRDLAYLQRLWKNIESQRKKSKKAGELYTESDLVIRTIRDIYTTDIDRIVVDNVSAARRAHNFLTVASPRSRSKVVYYEGKLPLYHRFGVEKQIDSIYSRTVPLPSGGSLVIDQTEALVAIDVNSGKSRDARDAETNAYKTNLEAVDEIARQLRLRDLGGVVVNDLIDMGSAKHRKQVEQKMRDNLKRDRARTRVGGISTFGTLEMTRQRMRPSLKSSLTNECEACAGTGMVKNSQSVVLDVMRRLARAMDHDTIARLELVISPDVAFHLLNRKRGHLVDLEHRFGKPVTVRVGGSRVDHVEIIAYDSRGSTLDGDATNEKQSRKTDGEDFVVLTSKALPGEGELVAALEIDDNTEDEIENAITETEEQTSQDQDNSDEENKPRRRRRRRGGRRRKKSSESQETESEIIGQTQAETDTSNESPNISEITDDSSETSTSSDETDEEQKPKRRRRRGGHRRKKTTDGDEHVNEAQIENTGETSAATTEQVQTETPADQSEESDNAPRKKRRRRGGRRHKKNTSDNGSESVETSTSESNDGSANNDGDGYSNKVLPSIEVIAPAAPEADA